MNDKRTKSHGNPINTTISGKPRHTDLPIRDKVVAPLAHRIAMLVKTKTTSLYH